LSSTILREKFFVFNVYQHGDGASIQVTISNTPASKRPGHINLLIIFRSRQPALQCPQPSKMVSKVELACTDYFMAQHPKEETFN
jgi:hypothetical protein